MIVDGVGLSGGDFFGRLFRGHERQKKFYLTN
jgi:hypothetical protein